MREAGAASLRLDSDGAELCPSLAAELLDEIEDTLAPLPPDTAGLRIVDCPQLARLLGSKRAVGAKAQDFLGPRAKAVRAILFDKSPAANWSLDWHQDRTIAVRERRDHPGFVKFSVKQGICHVEPPFDLTARMLTVRIHLDRVNAANGVLQIALGSHRLGRIEESCIARLVAERPIVDCLAERGDVWFYRTPILHRSGRSTSEARRRVLQVDYSADDLPGGMEWRGV